MHHWGDLERGNPVLAALGRRLINARGRAFLATSRNDGRPRVHPICPFLTPTGLYTGIICRSPKCHDLTARGHYVLHALPGPGDAEFWVEGKARPVGGTEQEELARTYPALSMPTGDKLFELEIAQAHGTLFHSGEDRVPVPDRRHWLGE